MATNIEVIGDALKDLNVIAETQVPSAEQGAYCLRQLNDMLESWTESNIELGYFAQSSPTDTCPIPAWAVAGVKAKLAARVATHYGAAISPELVQKIREDFGLIERKCMEERLKPARMDHLPSGEGWIGRRSRILTGE